ncbi:MAG: M42 family metallopeptidase [Planctomycetota bacterium]|nr:M42 family metallopeptidase [Planctomycetaceae bacterium]MDQ3331108.1 M42 family metallopeptidase [Planctomycetota bacterium]
MDAESNTLLESLLTAPGPSGYERPIQAVVREFGSRFAETSTDWHGNVTCAVNPSGTPRVLLAGHCDQIGLVVKHIDDKGFLRVAPVGGWDIQQLIGQAMVVWTANGPIPGVIARKAIHLLSDDERNKVPKMKDLFLDIGVKGRGEANDLVRIGDPVTLKLGLRKMRGDLISGPGMDDRVGVWVVLTAAQRAAAKSPKAGVFAVSTVQEEIGLRGARTSAYTIDPQVAIAVDVTHATDTPDSDQNEHGKVELGGGPVVFRGPNVNPVLFETLVGLAKANEIPIQVASLAQGASNDANALQLTRSGPATGIVAIPNRYMHSAVEVVSTKDLDHAANLLALLCCDLKKGADFTP